MIKLRFRRFDKRVALLLAVLIVAPLTARQSAPPTSLWDQAVAAEAALRFDVATARLYQIVVEHPRSADAWPARARLAKLLALAGEWPTSLLECQGLRNELPADHAFRQPAFDLATTMARRLRLAGYAAYFSGATSAALRGLASTDESTHIDVAPNGNMLIADSGQGRAVAVTAGVAATLPTGQDVTAAAFMPDGRTITADKTGIAIGGGKAAWFSGAWGGKTRQLKKTRSLAAMSNGDLLVVDKDYDGLLRCKVEGTCVPWGPLGKARVVAVGASDFVFVLDDKQQAVRVLDNTGRVAVVMGPTFAGLHLGEVVDIAVDRAYGLYILDKQTRRIEILTLRVDRTNSVSVVSLGFALVPSEGELALKNPSALAVMPDGSVVVAGRSAPRLLRFQ